MLRELQLANFKAFGEKVRIPIRPLTLIFGANSSGKSSIFQALLMLKQTLEESQSPETVLLPRGSLVDLGTYRDFVHRHRTDLKFEFGARFEREDLDDANGSEARKILENAGAAEIGFTMRFPFNEDRNTAKRPWFDFVLGNDPRPLVTYTDEGGRINYESDFWNSWWDVMKERIKEELGKGYNLKIWEKDRLNYLAREGKEEEYPLLYNLATDAHEEFRESLENYDSKEIIEDLKEMDLWLSYREFAKKYRSIMERSEKRRETSDQHQKNLAEEVIEEVEKIKDWQIKYSVQETISYEKFVPNRINPFQSLPRPGKGPPNWEINVLALYQSSDYNPVEEAEYNYAVEQQIGRSLSRFSAGIFSPLKPFLRRMVHLGPLRYHPERYLTFSGDVSEYVGQTGEHLPSLLFERNELLRRIDEDMERLELKYNLKLSRLREADGTLSNIFSLVFVDRNDVEANARDVGFGLSQILPIVVQCGISKNSAILIEQPEIHLHPAHQAELGDLFIRSALGEQRNTLLLETHSEHLLLRIMKRMRETNEGKPHKGIKVRPEDVQVLFVESDGSQSIVREMPLNENGELVKAWPGGFFEEGLREIF